MSITVNTNMSSLICQRSLTKATSGMNTALQRMSTGLKINSAKDDAAGCAISSKMDYKLSSYGVAQDNAQMGQSMLDTASGSLSVMNGMLQRMRDLSEQAANGTYGKEERQAMQAEVDALTKELYRIKNTTDFNGKKVLGEEEQHEITSLPTMDMSEVSAANWASTENQVIGISSAEDLLKLSTLTNDGNDTTNRTFCLTADINLAELGDIDGKGSNFTAIGNTANPFEGTFDGNGYTISNLTINKSTEKFQGFFGITVKAEIKNVNLEKVDITGYNSVGGVVGWNNNGNLNNCYSLGTVEGNSELGGLVGINDGIITNCYSSGTVTGDSNVGGLVGFIGFGKITNCWNSGAVSGNSETGGFVGYSMCGSILNCSYDKDSTGQTDDVGSNDFCTINPNPLLDSKVNPLKKGNTNTIKNVNLQVGINSDKNSVITVNTGFEIGDFKISLNTEGGARIALDKIDAMMAKVNAKQLDIGATSNRLASTMEFQSVQMSALTSANSLIKDADIAKESASYIKNQILQQTTATLLATANQNPSIALSLV